MNNYLPIFKQSNFNEIILDEGVTALIESYECMNNCFENANFSGLMHEFKLQENKTKAKTLRGKNVDT